MVLFFQACGLKYIFAVATSSLHKEKKSELVSAGLLENKK